MCHASTRPNPLRQGKSFSLVVVGASADSSRNIISGRPVPLCHVNSPFILSGNLKLYNKKNAAMRCGALPRPCSTESILRCARRLGDHRPDLLLIRLCLFAADVPLKNLPALVFHWKPGGLRNEYVFRTPCTRLCYVMGVCRKPAGERNKQKTPQETGLV